MGKHQRIWQYFQHHRVASIVVGHLSVVILFGLLLLGSTLGTHTFGAFAQSRCSRGDQTYIVGRGNTLGGIAVRYKTSWQRLASYNHIANPNIIYINETICIPKNAPAGITRGPASAKGTGGNPFPYGTCTWWAAQRYFQLHGIYVPWRMHANAWEWQYRAYDFHWRVSSRPAVGAILDLQPWVEGAYGSGHVAVVERVLSNGHVIASSMNWYPYYWKVTNAEFSPGPGVAFISS